MVEFKSRWTLGLSAFSMEHPESRSAISHYFHAMTGDEFISRLASLGWFASTGMCDL
jgi:hypothetical protein